MAAPLQWHRVLGAYRIAVNCLSSAPRNVLVGPKCRRQTIDRHWFSSLTRPTRQNAVPDVEIAQPPTAHALEAKSLQHHDYFGVRDLVSVKELFKARVHLGHKEGCRGAYMTPYLFGCRLGVDIINLDQTLPLFQDALNFTAHIAYRGGVILFLSRDRQTIPIVEKTAKESGEYVHCRYWKGGTFTNSTIQFDTMTRLPDLCIFVNTNNSVFNHHRALIESAKLLIPTIGIVDSNCDPRLVTYPVPGNDDTPTAVQYYCDKLKQAILLGKEKRKQDFIGANLEE